MLLFHTTLLHRALTYVMNTMLILSLQFSEKTVLVLNALKINGTQLP